MTMSKEARFEVAHDVHARRFHEELVILDLARGEYFSLDEVGARVWEAVSRRASLGEIVTLLGATYDTDVARIELDVQRLMGELVRRNLVVHIEGERA